MAQMWWALGFTVALLVLARGSRIVVIFCLALILAILTGYAGALR